MSQVMSAPSLVTAHTRAPERGALPYQIHPKSPTGQVAGGGRVGRGINLKQASRVAPSEVTWFYIFEEGRTQQAVTFQAVAEMLYSDVIPRDEIRAIWAEADRDRAAKVTTAAKPKRSPKPKPKPQPAAEPQPEPQPAAE